MSAETNVPGTVDFDITLDGRVKLTIKTAATITSYTIEPKDAELIGNGLLDAAKKARLIGERS